MRRMLTWLRLTMTPSRLNDLAVCHIHASRLSGIDNSLIRTIFVNTKSRKLEFKEGNHHFSLFFSKVLFKIKPLEFIRKNILQFQELSLNLILR